MKEQKLEQLKNSIYFTKNDLNDLAAFLEDENDTYKLSSTAKKANEDFKILNKLELIALYFSLKNVNANTIATLMNCKKDIASKALSSAKLKIRLLVHRDSVFKKVKKKQNKDKQI